MHFSKSAVAAVIAGVASLVAGQSASYGSGTSSSPQPSGSVRVWPVQVSNSDGSSLTFNPNTINATPGDMVQFIFNPKNHSVVQSTFANPCVPMPASNGVLPFFSGYMPVSQNDAMQPTFTVLVNDTKPIWFYCSQAKHCELGMVGVINPPTTGANTLEAFKANAAKVSKSEAPSSPESGSSSSTSSNSTSSGTSSGMSTMTTAASSTGSSSAPGASSSNANAPTNSAPGSYTSSSFTVALAALVAVALLI